MPHLSLVSDYSGSEKWERWESSKGDPTMAATKLQNNIKSKIQVDCVAKESVIAANITVLLY